MSDSGSKQTRIEVPIVLVVTGFGIGWLAGLSVSPVVSIVMSSVLGTVAAVVAVLSGLEPASTDGEKTASFRQFLGLQPKPWPIMCLVIGIAVGSMVGIRARNYHWFGSDLSSELAKWEAADLANNPIARRLFELQYPYTPYVRSKTLLEQDLSAEYTRWLSSTNTMTNTVNPALMEELTKRLTEGFRYRSSHQTSVLAFIGCSIFVGVFRISLVEPAAVEPTVFQLKGTIADSGQ